MQAVTTIAEVREQVKAWRREGLTVGLVPTMGFLHEGHKSLIVRAAAENDRVVVSDFVNPTQFGPTEDLESYPRDFERDCKLCEEAGAALVFHPEPSEMYAPNACTYVNMDELTHELCGLELTQLILEPGARWIHISYVPGNLRCQVIDKEKSPN